MNYYVMTILFWRYPHDSVHYKVDYLCPFVGSMVLSFESIVYFRKLAE